MRNTEIVLDFIDAWNTMDWNKAAGLLDENVVCNHCNHFLFGLVTGKSNDGNVLANEQFLNESRDTELFFCALFKWRLAHKNCFSI